MQNPTQNPTRHASSEASSILSATFAVEPTSLDAVTITKTSGSSEIWLDALADIWIHWQQADQRAELTFEMQPEAGVEFDSVSVGLLRDQLAIGKLLPITVDCQMMLPATLLVVGIDRGTWAKGNNPLYSVLFGLVHIASRKRWDHDPKIYSEGPETHYS